MRPCLEHAPRFAGKSRTRERPRRSRLGALGRIADGTWQRVASDHEQPMYMHQAVKMQLAARTSDHEQRLRVREAAYCTTLRTSIGVQPAAGSENQHYSTYHKTYHIESLNLGQVANMLQA